MSQPAKKVAFYTLGCKLNFTETSAISRTFVEHGYQKVSFSDRADYYIVNTCSVTHVADKKCRQAISKASKMGGRVIVIGCYAQLNPDEIKMMKGVDMVVGSRDKMKLVQYISGLEEGNARSIHTCNIDTVEIFTPAYSLHERTRSFLKIQDGCDYHCSYCTVPLARGKSRNSPIKNIIEQAELIAGNGLKEIVLTGVNIGDFGKSTGETFYDLLRSLLKVEGIERYRISSIEPELLTDEIIELVADSDKLAKHFHIPLQSGSNKVLALMKRRYNRELYLQKTERIRKIMPFASIGSDVIVGFPGETDQDFDDTYKFLHDADISYLHVFPYSERKNTPAAALPGKIMPAEKEERSARLISLSGLKKDNFYLKNISGSESVLFETHSKNKKMTGFTSNYITAETEKGNHTLNKLIQVKMKGILDNGNMEVEIL